MTNFAGVVLIVIAASVMSLAILGWATWRLRRPFPVEVPRKAWQYALPMLVLATVNLIAAATSSVSILRTLGLGLGIATLVVAGWLWLAPRSGRP